MHQITINKNTFTADKGRVVAASGYDIQADIIALGNNTFHILHNNRGYLAELVSNEGGREMLWKINGKTAGVQLKSKLDLLLEKMGIANANVATVNDVKAPMPGLILSVNCKPGDVVKKGDVLLVLEAMKMENTIKAQGDGTIKTIPVAKGDKVEKNQVLVVF